MRVLFDGQPGGALAIDGNDLLITVPAGVAGQSATALEVEIQGARTNALSVPVVAARPGILRIENADASVNSSDSPAAAGDIVTLVLTGDGGVDPSAMSVTVGGSPAMVIDGPPADDSGTRRITVQIPPDATGPSSIILAIGDASSPDSFLIWVQ